MAGMPLSEIQKIPARYKVMIWHNLEMGVYGPLEGARKHLDLMNVYVALFNSLGSPATKQEPFELENLFPFEMKMFLPELAKERKTFTGLEQVAKDQNNKSLQSILGTIQVVNKSKPSPKSQKENYGN